MEGNVQEMREALAAIRRWIEPICRYAEPDGEQPTALFAIADTVRDIVAKALAVIDDRAAKEQKDRFMEFCDDEKGDRQHCRNCRLCNACDCELAWAQMPYAAKEGGAE